MKNINKLVKRGWWKAMIHQGTLSLIFTLDDFLISGPHLITEFDKMSLSDPNIFFVKNPNLSLTGIDNNNIENRLTVSTYYVLRPYIRGILYGLTPIYQISLFVPCKDPVKVELYKEIISKIDIGGQFFQDRIYWKLENLQNDIMDSKLACLLYAGNLCLADEWLRKISIESRPFNATIESDLTKSDNLFDLVEIRSFLEDVHQRYFSLLNESKKIYFADMIRLHVEEKGQRTSGNSDITNTSGFYSTTNERSNIHLTKRCNSDHHFTKTEERKVKKDFIIFKTSENSPLTWNILNTNALLEEYEDIIQEQVEINNNIHPSSPQKSSFAKTLCRWNTITQRKSDLLRLLMNQKDKEFVHERLKQLNSTYCLKRSPSETNLFSSEQSVTSNVSAGSGSSDYLVISGKHESDCKDFVPFTTWYTKNLNL